MKRHFKRNRQHPGRRPGRTARGPKTPRVAAHAADVAPSKAKSRHRATPAKNANNGATSGKSPKKAQPAPARGARPPGP